MTVYIDAQRDRYGVEPICTVLQFAPATYYAAKARPASARSLRDEELKVEITRIWNEHRRVYGADKVCAQLRREGVQVARCTVERLMHDLGIRGVVRGKIVRTTSPIRPRRGPPTSSTDGSAQRRRIVCGWPT